jgi:hypothetical protein
LELAHVDPVQEDTAANRVVKTRDEAHERRLPGTRGPNDRHQAAGLRMEVDALQHQARAVLYPDLTDNSRAGKSGTIVSFQHGERRRRYGTAPVILPTPTGRSRVDLPHGACLVA